MESRFNLGGIKIQTSTKISPRKISKLYSLGESLFTRNVPCTKAAITYSAGR